jgi:hypothetical protein
VGNPAQLWLNLRTLLQRLKLFAGLIEVDAVCDSMWPEHCGSYEGVRRLTTDALIKAIEAGELSAIELAYWRWHAVMTERLVVDAFYKGGPQQTGPAQKDRLPVLRIKVRLKSENGMLWDCEHPTERKVDREFLLAFADYWERTRATKHGWKAALNAYGVTSYRIKKTLEAEDVAP